MAVVNQNLILMVRILIGDISAPQKKSDDFLSQTIITAGLISSTEIQYPQVYVFDLVNLTITPDPVASLDSTFQALVPLKSACILNTSDFTTSLGQAIKVRDGDSAIDTSVGFRGYRDILELGPCRSYEKLLWTLLANGTSPLSVGANFTAVRTPDDVAVGQLESFFNHFTHRPRI